MKRFGWMTAVVMGLAISTAACGGGAGGGDAKDASQAEGRAMDRLKAEVDGLDKAVLDIFKPIDDLEAALNAIGELPAKLKASAGVEIDAKALASVGKGVMQGKLDLSALKLDANAEAKAEVEKIFASIDAAVKSLAETDKKIAAIQDKFTGALTAIPALGAEATASATVDLANPFADDGVKVQAKADIEAIKGIVDGFGPMVDGWKKKLTEMPERSAAAMGKAKSAFGM